MSDYESLDHVDSSDDGYCPFGCYWDCEHKLKLPGGQPAPSDDFWLAEHNIWPPPMRAAPYDWHRWLGIRAPRRKPRRLDRSP